MRGVRVCGTPVTPPMYAAMLVMLMMRPHPCSTMPAYVACVHKNALLTFVFHIRSKSSTVTSPNSLTLDTPALLTNTPTPLPVSRWMAATMVATWSASDTSAW